MEHWEEEGRRLGALLDWCAAAVVVGAHPEAAAHVALGIGHVQGRRRRVAIGDLVGELPALESRAPGDDPHGIADSFLYGVSLNRIARPIPGTVNLFLLPSGTEPAHAVEILANERWRRLAAGFREVDALLLLVAPRGAEGLEALIGMTDGAVEVGEDILPAGVKVIASIRPPRARRSTVSAGRPSAAIAAEADDEGAEPATRSSDAGGAMPAATAVRRSPVARAVLLAAAALFVVGTVAAGWFLWRARTAAREPAAAPAPSTAAVDSAPPSSEITVPVVANPADSARAAGYGVLMKRFTTEAGAMAELQRLDDVPAATVALVPFAGQPWYNLVVGAAPTGAAADSLAAGLSGRGLARAGEVEVRRVPLAFLLEPQVPQDSVAERVAEWRGRGVAAYALRSDDGRAQLYAGAFESPEQAALAMDAMRSAGIAPPLVYRIGRAY